MYIATSEKINKILNYLEQNIGNCVYMFIDIGKYGLDNPNIKVWYTEDEDSINLVVMKYHDSLQIYSNKDNWNINSIMELVNSYKVSMISGRLDIIQKIHKHCNNIYKITSGCVLNLHTYKKLDDTGMVQTATVTDAREIAELICTDNEIGGHYSVENLTEQLIERVNTGMGRSLIVRKNGKIIAHIATYAEFGNIAVTSGLIVHPDFHDMPYGFLLESKLVNTLLEEGKQVFAFVIGHKRVKFLTSLGNNVYGYYGKLTLIKD